VLFEEIVNFSCFDVIISLHNNTTYCHNRWITYNLSIFNHFKIIKLWFSLKYFHCGFHSILKMKCFDKEMVGVNQ